ncbi:MAG: hypothetical protein MUE60_16840, partial [Candidatus Eisenbacteria bacterium]|nr:hypothetical protein [Candidatus Eisenbacteria bacterium]
MRDVMRLLVCALLSLSCARTIPPIVESYGALLARADSLQAGCRYDDAVTVLWQAVAADPQAIEPWLRIGSCMSRSAGPELALRHWDRILEVRPGETEARLGRWRALADLAVGSAHEESLTSVVRREVEVCAAAIPRTEETLELACRGYQILDEDW